MGGASGGAKGVVVVSGQATARLPSLPTAPLPASALLLLSWSRSGVEPPWTNCPGCTACKVVETPSQAVGGWSTSVPTSTQPNSTLIAAGELINPALRAVASVICVCKTGIGIGAPVPPALTLVGDPAVQASPRISVTELI